MKKLKKIIRFLSVVIVIMFSIYYFLEENGYLNKTSYAYLDTKEVALYDNSATLKIYYFDVGQADSTLIIDKDKTMLIDAGNNSDGLKIVNYIKSLGVTKLDYVVATHAHEDHIGGIDDIIDNFDIGIFYMPDAITTTTTFEDVLDVLERNKLKFSTPNIGDEFKLTDASFKVLYTGNDTTDLNNTSIVLKMTYGKYKYLFMGDATSKVEKILLNNETDLDADILKVGHHGSSYSTTDDFLNKVNPSYAIISCEKDNKYNHPSKEVITKLEKKNVTFYRTDLVGTILLTSDEEVINITTLKTDTNGG